MVNRRALIGLVVLVLTPVSVAKCDHALDESAHGVTPAFGHGPERFSQASIGGQDDTRSASARVRPENPGSVEPAPFEAREIHGRSAGGEEDEARRASASSPLIDDERSRSETSEDDEVWADEAPERQEEEEEVLVGSASAAQAPASITFSSPQGTLVSNPATLSVSATGPVARVEYFVDGGSLIGMSTSSQSGFSAFYSFWMAGDRTLLAKAYDSSQTLLATTTMVLTVPEQQNSATWEEPPPSSPPPSDPPNNAPPAESEEDDAQDSGTSQCPGGQILDCNEACANASWLNDGTCDDGTQYSADFACPALGMDGDDCGLQEDSPCPAGQIPDCNGLCAKASWVNDGICDDGSEYNVVFTCPEFDNDGGDCNAPAVQDASDSASTSGGTSTGGGSDVPYFYQYNNSLYPGASCQNTSVAMVLAWLGWSGVPDTITQAFGKNLAQSPAGLAQVFNHYAQSLGTGASLTPHTNGTLAGLQDLLSAGLPTIVHGYFSASGHVVVATGYDGVHYTVHDPAGVWSQTFKGGYPYGGGSTAGKGVKYTKAAFEQAIATSNGSSFLPLWYHELTL